MDGILVFSKQDDIIFIHANKCFTEHINKKGRESGLIDSHAPETNEIDANVVLQLYSPILMSQKAMIGKLHNAYHSISCDNGITFVFSQHQNDIYIAVTDIKEKPIEFIRRKLLVVQHLLSFLFGPVHDEIKPDRLKEREERWKLLSRLIETWEQLFADEQCYLVEALERLHVNQMLNSKCIELLESTLSVLRSAGEKHSLHAILFVNSKLLSLYSSRNAYELQTVDIMLITILLKASFPNNQKLEDLFARSYSTYSTRSNLTSSMPVYIRSDGDRYESASEGHDSDIEYFSTPSTPKESPLTSREDFKTPTSNQGATLNSGNSMGDSFFTPSSTPFSAEKSHMRTHSEVSMEGNEAGGRTHSPTNQSTASTHSASSADMFQDRYHCYPVFLSTPSCKVTPHTLHLVEVLPGMSLVVVCEVPKGKQAGILYSTLSILWAMICGSHRTLGSARAIAETVDSHLKKTQDFVKKLKGSNTIDRITKAVQKHWTQAKEAGLMQHLDQRDRGEPNHRIEDSLSNMYDGVRKLFRALYIQPKRHVTESFLGAVDQARHKLRKQLRDYEAYLAVKAQRNIAITSYVEEFPGLVHFIFVDRTSHQMTAPSINISTEDEDKITAYVKKEIWRVYPLMQSKLQSGHMTVSIRHGDFLYSYFLWFEDSTGNPIAAQQPYNGSISTPPGILAGPFYRQLLKQCFPSIGSQRSIHCYELLAVHIGIVPSQYALKHARNLVHRMWETSGEADSPISLL